MNFKSILLLFVCFVVSCGVKGPPRPPHGRDIPPIINNYPDAQLDASDIEKIEKSGFN